MIRFDNGAVLAVEASFEANLANNNDIQLLGTKAGVQIGKSVHVTTEYHGYLADVEIDGKTKIDVNEAFENELNHFVDCILDENKTCVSPAEDGVALMQILDAIYRSAKSGHEEVIEG
jgi:predicted dehydrogenase